MIRTENIFSEVVQYSISLMQVPDVGHEGAEARNPPITAEQTTGASLPAQSIQKNPVKRRLQLRLVLENSKTCEM